MGELVRDARLLTNASVEEALGCKALHSTVWDRRLQPYCWHSMSYDSVPRDVQPGPDVVRQRKLETCSRTFTAVGFRHRCQDDRINLRSGYQRRLPIYQVSREATGLTWKNSYGCLSIVVTVTLSLRGLPYRVVDA